MLLSQTRPGGRGWKGKLGVITGASNGESPTVGEFGVGPSGPGDRVLRYATESDLRFKA